jgi:hypothetical protein
MAEEPRPLVALLVPTEKPPTELELKRALLSFDEIHVLDPDDRDMMDPAAFMNAMSGGLLPVFMGGEDGKALPLPKTASFDEEFGKTIEAFDKAGCASSLVIKPKPTFFKGFGLGAVPTPAGWASPAWTLQTFRGLAANADFLRASAASLKPLEDSLEEVRTLRAANPRALASSNVLPSIASLGWVQPGEDAELLDYLAAARLGAFVKTLGLCAVQGYQPFTTDPGMDGVLRLVAGELQRVSGSRPHAEPALMLHVSLVQSVFLEEVLDHEALNAASVADVVRLRTRAWGKAQAERKRFLMQVGKIAAESPDTETFQRTVQKEVETYLKACADLDHDWRKIWVRTGLALSGGAAASSTLGSLLQGLFPAGLDVALGAAAALLVFGSDVSDQVLDQLRTRREVAETAGAALLRPYRYFAKRTRSSPSA